MIPHVFLDQTLVFKMTVKIWARNFVGYVPVQVSNTLFKSYPKGPFYPNQCGPYYCQPRWSPHSQVARPAREHQSSDVPNIGHPGTKDTHLTLCNFHYSIYSTLDCINKVFGDHYRFTEIWIFDVWNYLGTMHMSTNLCKIKFHFFRPYIF